MLEIRLDAQGLTETLKALDTQRIGRAQYRWMREGSQHAKDALRSRAPRIVRARVKVKMDPLTPPGWALVGSTHPLAHIFEGGTGRRGAPGFRHGATHFPRVTGPGGLMETTGLPRPQAFAIAKSIADAGGLTPQPFVGPTFAAEEGYLIRLAEQIVRDEIATR